MTALVSLSLLSPKFDYYIPWLERPNYMAVMLMVSAGIAYVAVMKTLMKIPYSTVVSDKLNHLVKGIFILGLLMRLVFLGSTPIYEDDFYRYFFDGSLVANGINPYEYAPQDALIILPPEGASELNIAATPTPPAVALSHLSEQPLVERVAYPRIRTIYPPITQVFFALSNLIKPFDIDVWRMILMVTDSLSFFVLLAALRAYGKSICWVAVYWLNPLLITETFNSAHMDILLVPFLLGSLLFAKQSRFILAGGCLALAAGIKLWPLILAPVLFRSLLKTPKILIVNVFSFSVLTAIILAPQLVYSLSFTGGLDNSAGVVNYSQYWRTNSFLFGAIENLLVYISEFSWSEITDPQALARYLILSIMLLITFFVTFKFDGKMSNKLVQSWLWITVALFMFSPTSYPWYIIWFLPLLALSLSKITFSLLLLTAFLPLYYLRYPLMALNKQHVFDDWVITFEFLPILLSSIYIWFRTGRSSKSA